MRIATVWGVIARRLLANFRVDPDALSRVVPAPSRMSRGLRCLFAVVVGASLIGACSNSDVTAQLEAAESLVAEFDLTQTTGPSEVVSKTLHYVTASGLMDGDQETVVRSVEERLTATGWSVVLVQSLDVSGSPASKGSQVVANKDGLAVQVAVFDQVGLNPAPLGLRHVQMSVARSSDPVAWAGLD